MRVNDIVGGILVLAFGLAVTIYAWRFPAIAGQQIGPSFFPVVIGTALALLGAVLVLQGVRRPSGAAIALDDWVRRPRVLARFLLVIAALLFYAGTVDVIGFFPAALVFLSGLMLAFGVPPRRVLPIAALVTLAIHYGFYTLLRVPLPWGPLEALAW